MANGKSYTVTRPIHLTATASLNPTTSAPINALALAIPNQPVEIRQFKFGMLFSEIGTASGVGLTGDGGGLGVQIAVNSEPVTNGYVPVWNFDKCVNVINEQTYGVGTTKDTAYGEFVWNLRNGLYLRPEDQLAVSFSHLGTTPNAITARFSASGSVVEGGVPRFRSLPYASAYISKQFVTNAAPTASAADSDSSTESDLANITNNTIYLQRMTGRLNAFSNVSPVYYSDQGNGGLPADDFGANILSLRMFSGLGVPIVPYPTLFRTVFSGPTRSWELDGEELAPGDYFLMNLTLAAVNGSGATSPVAPTLQQSAQANVALVGWREVAL